MPSKFDTDEIASSGHIYLFRWLHDRWNDEAAKHIFWQFLIFYGLMAVGFVCLYVMMKSTGQVRAQLRDIRRNVVEALNEQRERKWDVDDYSKSMNGAGFM